MSTVKYLDLDAIAEEAVFTLKLNSKEHKLQVATVKMFAENMRDVQETTLDASITDELKVIVRIVKRAFPTMTDEDIENLTLPQLRTIADFALKASSEAVSVEKQDDQGN